MRELKAHGVKKVLPDDEDLQKAYAKACQIALVNREIERILSDFDAKDIELPEDLRETISQSLAEEPVPWDELVFRHAQSHVITEKEK